MTWLESLVDARRATRTEWRTLRHLQRRMARARQAEPPFLRAMLMFGAAVEAQQTAQALAFMRAIRTARAA